MLDLCYHKRIFLAIFYDLDLSRNLCPSPLGAKQYLRSICNGEKDEKSGCIYGFGFDCW